MPGLKLMQATVLKVQEVFKKWAGGDNYYKFEDNTKVFHYCTLWIRAGTIHYHTLDVKLATQLLFVFCSARNSFYNHALSVVTFRSDHSNVLAPIIIRTL